MPVIAELILGLLAAVSLLVGLLGVPLLVLSPQTTSLQEIVLALAWVVFAVSFAGAMVLHHLRHARTALERIEALLERR